MTEPQPARTRRPSRWGSLLTRAVVGVWLAALVIPPVVLATARPSWLAALDRPEQQADWDVFRGEMRRQSGRDGPVQRKVPKSAEPPARVWLRDYFPLAVVAWILFVGVLGGFFCLLVAGAVQEPPPAPQRPPEGSSHPPAQDA